MRAYGEPYARNGWNINYVPSGISCDPFYDAVMDPFTAVAMATSAFKTIQKMVAAGQEVENALGQIGKWYGAVADFNEAKKQAENPPLFRRLVNKTSVEEEAMTIYMQDKKIQQQEKVLRELLMYTYGPSGYDELVRLRRSIRETREKTVYAQARRRKALMWNTLGTVALCGMSYGIYIVAVIIYNAWPEK